MAGKIPLVTESEVEALDPQALDALTDTSPLDDEACTLTDSVPSPDCMLQPEGKDQLNMAPDIGLTE